MDDATPIPGGPGWVMDPRTLLPVLVDEQVFRAHHADDPFCEALVLLWSGRAVEAEAELHLVAAGSGRTPRWRALVADTWRDQGRVAEALEAYDTLVGECRGTAREAVMVQHRGKVRLVAGDAAGAARDFARALDLRLRDGAPSELVTSSRAALTRALAVASR